MFGRTAGVILGWNAGKNPRQKSTSSNNPSRNFGFIAVNEFLKEFTWTGG